MSTSAPETRSSPPVMLLRVLCLMAGAAGRALDGHILMRLLNARPAQLHRVMHALESERLCRYDELTDAYYPDTDFWAFCNFTDTHMVEAINRFTPRLWARVPPEWETAP